LTLKAANFGVLNPSRKIQSEYTLYCLLSQVATMAPPLLGFSPFRWLGVFFIALRLPVLLNSFACFAWQGLTGGMHLSSP
jgi:hypothetical protein